MKEKENKKEKQGEKSKEGKEALSNRQTSQMKPRESISLRGASSKRGGDNTGKLFSGPLKRPPVPLPPQVFKHPLSYGRRAHIRLWVMIVLHSPLSFLFSPLPFWPSPSPFPSSPLPLPFFLPFPLLCFIPPSSLFFSFLSFLS